MQKHCISAIAVSLFLSGSAYAVQGPAFSSLLSASAGFRAADPAVPAPVPAAETIVQALPGDLHDLPEAETAQLIPAARTEGFAIFQLDGSRMTTKKALMAHTSKVLDLPSDMDSWDAMIDYMSDMPQIHGNEKQFIVVKNSYLIYTADPQLYADLREAVRLSCRHIRETLHYPAFIKFIFVP